MDILDLIKSRRSIRNYEDKPVPHDLIEQVVEAGIWAPSSMNRQPWRFVVISDKEKRDAVAKKAKKQLLAFLGTDKGKAKWAPDAAERFKKRAEDEADTIFYDAPTVIFVIKKFDAGNDNYDYGLATQNMMLMAHSRDLGTCTIGLAKPLNNSEIAREMLKMKEGEEIVVALCLGYPAESPDIKERDFDCVDWIE